jgi:fructuronate reductase
VQIASAAGSHWQIGGAIWQTCLATRERAQVVSAIAAAATRWLTLTVTEKGYGPVLAELIVDGLAARHAAGLPGLTVACCDNLSNNGRMLQALCVNTAAARNNALADWITAACRFPNSMVDRIVPAATAERLASAADALGAHDHGALGTEAFCEWVIERRFVDDADGDALAAHGVTVVNDVAPFEEAKLRLLNGSHTAMASIGAVIGLPFIRSCIADPDIHRFIHGLMTKEVGPQLSRPDWPAYCGALLERFGNPTLDHKVHQIAMDGSQKIPQRWPPSVSGAMQRGLPVDHLAFAAAAWLRYLQGADERGARYVIDDPMAEDLRSLAQQHAGNAAATVAAIATMPSIWGDRLPHEVDWLARVTHWLTAIQTRGMQPALAHFHSQNPT